MNSKGRDEMKVLKMKDEDKLDQKTINKRKKRYKEKAID